MFEYEAMGVQTGRTLDVLEGGMVISRDDMTWSGVMGVIGVLKTGYLRWR